MNKRSLIVDAVKRTLVTSGLVLLVIALGALISLVFLVERTVSGIARDTATGAPIGGVVIVLGDHSTSSSSSGRFSFPHLDWRELGRLTVESVPDGYDAPESVEVNQSLFGARSTDVTFDIAPTLQATAERVCIASFARDFAVLWTYLHPDSQARWGNDSSVYAKLFQEFDSTRPLPPGATYTFVGVGKNLQKHAQWTSSLSGKQYSDVIELSCEGSASYLGLAVRTMAEPIFLQETNGYFHTFGNSDKDSLEKELRLSKSPES